jgi:hypothetical protein
MIQANELRIGNYVIDKEDGHFHKIASGKAIDYPQLMQPIELTEEILLKCGAVLNPHSKLMKSYWLHLKRNLYLTFSDVETANFMVSLICMDDNEIVDCNIIHNWDYDKQMYLHELQNIFKDLSKTELQITL